MSDVILATEGLSLSFGALAVTQDVNYSLPKGARYALIGPNGAGKTTLINLLTGVFAPAAGRITLAGEDITKLAPHERVKRGIARTFQINTLFGQLTPLQAVTLAICERRGVGARWLASLGAHKDAVEEAYALLELLNLASSAERTTVELAYGRQRLLEIALALAMKPKVLLLDEPAAGVPVGESGELFDVISNLPGDIAILFIEHDMNLVFKFAKRITVLVSGKIIVEGTPKEIAADPQVREVYLGRGHHHA
jgi:ABC-type branched-subunit amino acid transport system ATPase component